MTFYIIINTYNRPKMLRRLIRQIVSDISTSRWYLTDIKIQVYLDGCNYKDTDYHYIGVPVHFKHCWRHGKDEYYKLVQEGFKDREQAKYYLKIDDDMVLEKDFFETAVDIWESLPEDKFTLNLLRDQRTSMWGGEPEESNGKYFKSNWVDLNFMCQEPFMKMMDDFTLIEKPGHIQSSGVGRQITRHIRGVYLDHGMDVNFREAYGGMYQVDKTLLLHGEHGSVMNPERTEKLTDI